MTLNAVESSDRAFRLAEQPSEESFLDSLDITRVPTQKVSEVKENKEREEFIRKKNIELLAKKLQRCEQIEREMKMVIQNLSKPKHIIMGASAEVEKLKDRNKALEIEVEELRMVNTRLNQQLGWYKDKVTSLHPSLLDDGEATLSDDILNEVSLSNDVIDDISFDDDISASASGRKKGNRAIQDDEEILMSEHSVQYAEVEDYFEKLDKELENDQKMLGENIGTDEKLLGEIKDNNAENDSQEVSEQLNASTENFQVIEKVDEENDLKSKDSTKEGNQSRDEVSKDEVFDVIELPKDECNNDVIERKAEISESKEEIIEIKDDIIESKGDIAEGKDETASTESKDDGDVQSTSATKRNVFLDEALIPKKDEIEGLSSETNTVEVLSNLTIEIEQNNLSSLKKDKEQSDLSNLNKGNEQNDLSNLQKENEQNNLSNLKKENEQNDLSNVKKENEQNDLSNLKKENEQNDLSNLKKENERKDSSNLTKEKEQSDLSNIKIENDLSNLTIKNEQDDLSNLTKEKEQNYLSNLTKENDQNDPLSITKENEQIDPSELKQENDEKDLSGINDFTNTMNELHDTSQKVITSNDDSHTDINKQESIDKEIIKKQNNDIDEEMNSSEKSNSESQDSNANPESQLLDDSQSEMSSTKLRHNDKVKEPTGESVNNTTNHNLTLGGSPFESLKMNNQTEESKNDNQNNLGDTELTNASELTNTSEMTSPSSTVRSEDLATPSLDSLLLPDDSASEGTKVALVASLKGGKILDAGDTNPLIESESFEMEEKHVGSSEVRNKSSVGESSEILFKNNKTMNEKSENNEKISDNSGAECTTKVGDSGTDNKAFESEETVMSSSKSDVKRASKDQSGTVGILESQKEVNNKEHVKNKEDGKNNKVENSPSKEVRKRALTPSEIEKYEKGKFEVRLVDLSDAYNRFQKDVENGESGKTFTVAEYLTIDDVIENDVIDAKDDGMEEINIHEEEEESSTTESSTKIKLLDKLKFWKKKDTGEDNQNGSRAE